jgi:Tol biopolymer transport system component
MQRADLSPIYRRSRGSILDSYAAHGMKTRRAEKLVIAVVTLSSFAATGAVIISLALFMMALASQLLLFPAFSQTKPAFDLEGAIAKEQVDGDLKTAISAYQSISADPSAPRDVRAKALMHLASCYEKLGQQAQNVYEQVVREFGDQPVAVQARSRLARYSKEVGQPKNLKLERLTANTAELPIQAAVISPDGKTIAYSDPLGIHIHSSVTGETRLLPETQGDRLLRWMPDGNSLQAKVVDSKGRMEAAIISLSGGASTAALAFDGFSSSPDRAQRATASADNRAISLQSSVGQNVRVLWKASGKNILDQFQWSPTGAQIVVASSIRDPDGNKISMLELVDVASGREKVLIPSEKKLFISSIVWVTHDRLIISIDEDVSGVNQYNSDLWELKLGIGGDLTPGGLRRLTTWTDFPIRAGSLSTDGKTLVLIRSFRQRDAYVASFDASNTRLGTPKRFTLDLGDDYPSDWTSDSKTVILTSDRSGMQGIYRQDLEKMAAERIVTMPGHQLLARVTPDGVAVLFINYDSAKGPHSQLMRVPIAGGTARLVPNVERIGFNYRCPLTGICVMAQKQGEGFVISELDPDRGKGREIYHDSHIDHFHISPDGQWISNISGKGPETKIVIRSFSTGEISREISLPGATNLVHADWASDGSGFFWGDITTTEIREMYVDLDRNISVLWRHAADYGDLGDSFWGVPSPDGKQLAMVLLTDDSNVYTVKNF